LINLFRLIGNEWIKWSKKLITKVCFALVVLLVIVHIILNALYTVDPREGEDLYTPMQEMVDSLNVELGMLNSIPEPTQEDLDRIVSVEAQIFIYNIILEQNIDEESWKRSLLDEVYEAKMYQLNLVKGGNATAEEYSQAAARVSELSYMLYGTDGLEKYIEHIYSEYENKTDGISLVYMEEKNIRMKYGITPDNNPENWKNEALKKITSHRLSLYYNSSDDPLMHDGLDAEEVTRLQNEVDVLLFRIENNAPPIDNYLVVPLQYYLENAQEMIKYLMFIVVVLGCHFMASEHSSKTIRLLLISPYKRSMIWTAKLLTLFAFSVVMYAMFVVLAFAVGIIFYGTSELHGMYVYMSQAGVVQIPYMKYAFMVYGVRIFELIMMCSFAYMLSNIIRSSVSAVSIGFVITLLGQQLVEPILTEARFNWAKYLMFANTDLSQFMFANTPVIASNTLGVAIAISAVYFVVLNTISIISFIRKEVV